MKKLISIVAIMVMLLLVLTGCVQVNYEVKLNENGTADVTFIYGFEKETLEQLGATSDDMTKETKESSEKDGYTIEDYEDEKIAGIKASKHFENASEISFVEVFDEENITESEDGRIKIEKKGSDTVFSQNTEIDFSKMDETTSSMMTVIYTIKLPVKAAKSNATTVSEDGKTLTWELKTDEVNKIEFEAVKKGSTKANNGEAKKEINYALLGGIAAAIVVAVVGVLIIVLAIGRNKKNKVTENKENDENNENNNN